VDVIVIGDGPGGLSAALFLAKNGLKVAVYGEDKTAMHWALVRNYLGLPEILGSDFQRIARQQVTRHGAQLLDLRQASEWLVAKRYSVLHRNWRYGRKEIDIIAAKEGTLHIIEIKTRRTADFGPPETQVNRRKIKHLREAAAGFLEEHPQ